MIAKNNPDLLKASNDLYTVNADELIRQQARARADAEFWERNRNAKIKRLEDALVEKNNELAEKDTELAEKNDTIARNQSIIAEKEDALAKKDAELLQLKEELAKLKQN